MPIKKTTKKVKEATATIPSCEVCKGYGRVSDKESCEDCQGTGVKK